MTIGVAALLALQMATLPVWYWLIRARASAALFILAGSASLVLAGLAAWALVRAREAPSVSEARTAWVGHAPGLLALGLAALVAAFLFWCRPSEEALPLIRLTALLTVGLVTWRVLTWRGVRLEGPPAGGAGRHSGTGPAATVVIALIAAYLVARAAFPVVARKVEWGRFGFGPPVPLRDLSPITEKLRVRVPAGTRVVSGEFIAGSDEHLTALLEMPASRVHEFLGGQRFEWRSEKHVADLVPEPPTETLRHLEGKPNLVCVEAAFPWGTDFLSAVIDLSGSDKALVYLHWRTTDEEMNW